jgi:hypothetical protein
MNTNLDEDQVARQLAEEVNQALNKKIEERFRKPCFWSILPGYGKGHRCQQAGK